jgi:hypothetical protein
MSRAAKGDGKRAAAIREKVGELKKLLDASGWRNMDLSDIDDLWDFTGRTKHECEKYRNVRMRQSPHVNGTVSKQIAKKK